MCNVGQHKRTDTSFRPDKQHSFVRLGKDAEQTQCSIIDSEAKLGLLKQLINDQPVVISVNRASKHFILTHCPNNVISGVGKSDVINCTSTNTHLATPHEEYMLEYCLTIQN